MNNNYQLSGRIHTTGWNPSFDVNSTNDYGMTPTEVAMQAGNLNEFVEITSHPDFKLAIKWTHSSRQFLPEFKLVS
jgi:hypothetical protein